MENQELGFGAIERKPTVHDVQLGSFTPSTRPDVYMPSFTGTIEMQGKQPACGAHAGQAVKQVMESFRGSPEYVWKKIKLIDGFPPESGTDMLSIMKVLQKTGITSYDLMTNNTDVTLEAYADASTITPELDSEALKHKVGIYAFTWNPTLEQLKQAIYDHKAVIMLLRVGQEWWTDKNGNGSWAEKDILPLRSTVPITSGHFVTAFGYDEQYIYFLNQWSSAWGRNGIGYFGSDYLSRCVEIGTTVNAETTYLFTKVLKFGMNNADVRMLQIKLGVPADGRFGKQTLKAVQDFQTKHGLVADGIVGKLTNEKLNG